MNIVVLCPHFAPDVAPTGEVMTAIASELTKRGHRLHVITSLPWYQNHALEPGWDGQLVRHEQRSWGTITRVHPFPTDKRNLPARAVAFGGFTVLATLEGAMSKIKPDVVLAMSPPLTLGLAGWMVSRVRRVPFVFNIQDVFPDVAVELGLLTGRRTIAAARWLERASYRRADAVTVLSDDLADNVRAKLVKGLDSVERETQASKVRVIPNFIDTTWITPGPTENDYRVENGLSGKRVVMYAGNVGLSQALDLVLDAAVALRHEADIAFVINGGGAALPDLERRAHGMSNVHFVPMAPKEQLPRVLAAADVHVVPLKRGLAWSSVPSKLYSILAAGRPLVASVDPGTEVARTVEAAEAGITVAPEDAEAFTKALRQILDDPQMGRDMGASGRKFVESWASPAAVAEAYENLFFELRG
ncbi:MAG: glycosyltransferase family 4 protein [Actinomycetes bacterium]